MALTDYKIQARASGEIPLSSLCVFYEKAWCDCEGADRLTVDECQELVMKWTKADKRDARSFLRSGKPHEYRIVHYKQK